MNIIIGFDPGTTVGLAVLDLKGNVKHLDSYRNISLGKIIDIILEEGNPVIVSCDKKIIPSTVKNLAIKLGAKIIGPPDDISVQEKRELVKNIKTKNDHERDALGSALFAYNKTKNLVQKIDSVLQKKNISKENSIKTRKLVLSSNLSISLAIDLLTNPQKEESAIVKNAIQNDNIDDNYVRLLNKLKQSEEMIKILKIQNYKQKKELNKKFIPQKQDNYYKREFDLIKKVNLKIQNDLKNIINNIGHELIVIKKIVNPLKYNEKVFYLEHDNMLNLSEISKVRGIAISEKKLHKIKNNITKNKIIIIYENKRILIARKDSLDKEIKKLNLLENVIDEYRKKRRTG